jgi:hypothetical protein
MIVPSARLASIHATLYNSEWLRDCSVATGPTSFFADLVSWY